MSSFGHKRKLVSFSQKVFLVFCFILILSQGSAVKAATLGDFFSDGLTSYTSALTQVKDKATVKVAGFSDTLKDGLGTIGSSIGSKFTDITETLKDKLESARYYLYLTNESPASAPASQPVNAPASDLPAAKTPPPSAVKSEPQVKSAVQVTPVKKPALTVKAEPKEAVADTPVAKALKSDTSFSFDALTGIVTLKGLRVAGLVDFTGADVRGLPTVAAAPAVSTANPTAPPPLQNVSNTFISASPVSVQPVVGTIGGVSTDFSVGRNLTVASNAFVDSTLTVGTATTNGALTVNGSAAISTTLGVTGATTLTGALTANGNVTLGDAAGDTITVNGRLSTLNISDGSTTSSLAKNSFYIAADSSNALGKFYVDSSGNVSASGTLTTFGTLTLGSHLYPASDNLYDIGSSSTQWRYGNFQGGLLVADGTTTSTLSNNSIISGQTSGYNLGKFYVDSSGNITSSGTLAITGHFTPYTDNLYDIGSSSTQWRYGNFQGGLLVADGTTTSTLSNNSIISGQTSGSNLGKFYVDSSGNVSASGSLLTFGNVTSTGILYATNGLIASASSTFSSNLFVSGDFKASSTLQATGDLTIYGNTTLGDVAGDAITVNGRLSTLNVSDGSTTSSLAKNSFHIAADSSNALGKFYIDSSGNTSVSGTLTTFGALTFGGHLNPATDNLYDIGSSSTQWRYGNFQGGLLVGNGSATSTFDLTQLYLNQGGTSSSLLNNSSLTLGIGTGYNSGMFYVDNSGNITASGTIRIPDGSSVAPAYSFSTDPDSGFYNDNPGIRVAINGSNYAAFETDAFYSLSTIKPFSSSVALFLEGTIADAATAIGVKIGNTVSLTVAGSKIASFYSDAATTEKAYIDKDGGIGLAVATGYNNGKFNVDSSGNTNVSGTLRVYGSASTGGLQISASNTTTTLTSYVSGSGVGAFVLDTNTLFTPASSTVLLSVRNAGTRVFSISNDGYVASTGTFNANVASTGIGDVAEYVNLIPNETVEPGDVLVVSKDTPNQYKKSSASYTKEIAGVVSDTGAFVMGASGVGRAPLALAGLVKVKVSLENGNISVGDYLVSSAKPGYAMKYDTNNPQAAGLVGMALEPATADGKITIMVNKGLLDGAAVTNLNVTENVQGQLAQNGDLNLLGYNLLGVKSVVGADNKWQISEDGKFVRRLTTSKGDKEIYGLGSASGDEIVLSGSSQLENGQKKIVFEEIDQEVIARDAPFKVLVTLSGESVGVFTAERTYQGFLVKELNGGTGNATFDWVVIAKKKSEAQADIQVAPQEEPKQEEPKQEEPKKEDKDDKKNDAAPAEPPALTVIPIYPATSGAEVEESSPTAISETAP